MSDENQNNPQEKPDKCTKGASCLLIITFILALLAFLMSSYISFRFMIWHPKSPIHTLNAAPVVISKKYDKNQNFEKAHTSGKPAVVFFYVDWCQYCQRFAPIFDKVTKDKDLKKNLAVAYVNCEDPKNANLVQEFKIQHYPTVYLVKGDEITELPSQISGVQDGGKTLKAALLEFATGKLKDADDEPETEDKD